MSNNHHRLLLTILNGPKGGAMMSLRGIRRVADNYHEPVNPVRAWLGLRLLAAAGCVAVDSSAERPRYHITEAGRQRLAASTASTHRMVVLLARWPALVAAVATMAMWGDPKIHLVAGVVVSLGGRAFARFGNARTARRSRRVVSVAYLYLAVAAARLCLTLV